MLARILWYLDPLSSHQQQKKNSVEVDLPLANFLDPRMYVSLFGVYRAVNTVRIRNVV